MRTDQHRFSPHLVATVGVAVSALVVSGLAHEAAAAPDSRTTGARYVEAAHWSTDGAPSAVGVAPDGSVAVTMATRDKVSRFTPTGGLLNSFLLDFSYPFGIDADPSGNIHISDYSATDSTTQLHVFSPSGTEVRTYGVPDGASSNFSPWGLDISSDGTVLIADVVDDSVQRVHPDGSWGGRLGASGAGPGQFDSPRDIAYGNGGFYVLDSGNRRVQRFSSDGTFLAAFGQSGLDPGQFDSPVAIDVAPDGRVLVLDRSGAQDAVLNEFSPEGGFLGRTTLPMSQAGGMAVDAQGAVYVTGLYAGSAVTWGVLKLVVATPTPTPTPTPSPGPPAAAQVGTVKVPGKAIRVRRGRVAIRAVCPESAAAGCSATARLARGKRLVAKPMSYSLDTGEQATIRFRLTRSALRRLPRRKSVTLTVRLFHINGQTAVVQKKVRVRR